jgi:hypothetical protein
MVELRLESVMRLLGEPGDVLACLGHGYSLPASADTEVRRGQRGPVGIGSLYGSSG